jgi:hypothetical protein
MEKKLKFKNLKNLKIFLKYKSKAVFIGCIAK